VKQSGFPRTMRLTREADFKTVLQYKKCLSSSFIRLYYCKNGLEFARLGISINRLCCNAVLRNRIKRLIKEAFRLNQDDISAGYDYLFVISPRKLGKVSGTELLREEIKKLDSSNFRDNVIALLRKVEKRK
jgi:ribonuclease P protein component